MLRTAIEFVECQRADHNRRSDRIYCRERRSAWRDYPSAHRANERTFIVPVNCLYTPPTRNRTKNPASRGPAELPYPNSDSSERTRARAPPMTGRPQLNRRQTKKPLFPFRFSWPLHHNLVYFFLSFLLSFFLCLCFAIPLLLCVWSHL